MKNQTKITIDNYTYNNNLKRTKKLNSSHKITILLCVLLAMIGFSFNVSAQCGFEWEETTDCTVDFEVNTGTGYDYEIDMGDGTILNSTNGPVFTYQYSNSDSYTLVLTYYKNGSPACGATHNITVVGCENEPQCADPLSIPQVTSEDCNGITVDFIFNLPINGTAENISFAFTSPENDWTISPAMLALGFAFTGGGGLDYSGPPLQTSDLTGQVLATYTFNGNPGECTSLIYNLYYWNGNFTCPDQGTLDTFDYCLPNCCTNCEDFNPTPPSFTFTNILDPCFIEFNNFENAELNCPLTTPGYYIMDYGDGTTDGPNSTANCDNHVYSCDGIYEACLTYYYTTPNGELCETSFCNPNPIEISGCNDCCEDCNVETEVSEVSVDGCFATVCNHATFEEPCIKPTYSWTVDGDPAIDSSPKDPTTFSSQFNCNGTYEICATVTVFNIETGLFCSDTDCVNVTIEDCNDCPCDIEPPINLQVIANGILRWGPVPAAVSYIVSSPPGGKPILDCNCKHPISILPITISANGNPPFTLPLNLQDRCFVWQVQAICADGTVSGKSKQHCYPSKKFVLAEELDEPIKEVGPRKFAEPEEINTISVYPNPTTNHFTIDLIADEEEHLSIQLIDQSGKLILENDKPILKGYNQFTFNFTDISRGVYVLKFASEHVNEYKKLMLIK